MEARLLTLKPEDIPQSFKRAFALDVLEGLSRHPRQIPPVYLYDKRGCELFREISTMEEYYLTRCEYEIFMDRRQEIIDSFKGGPFNLVELGAGDGHKTLLLIDRLISSGLDFEYIPIDVSPESVNELVLNLEKRFSGSKLRVKGLIADYFDGIKWLARISGSKNVLLFLGSNIGNFDRQGMHHFLHCLWNCMKPGDQMLAGFDLRKDVAVLNRAYNDSRGITREFNLNLLERINRELGANFNREKFTFYSSYCALSGAVESFLLSTEKQQVWIDELKKSFSFEAWEGIQTETSHKFLESEIESLASDTGFRVEKRFFDSRNYFVDSLWTIVKHD